MLKVLLVGETQASMIDMSDWFTAMGAQVYKASCGLEALRLAKSRRPDLAVVDECISDLTAKKFVSGLIQLDASINAAIISPQDPADFHEHYEGLGLMGQLKPESDITQVRDLMDRLSRMVA